MMNNKKFTRYFLLLVFVALNVVIIINYSMDPYWTFKHSHMLNNKQIDLDERQQKTNYLHFVNNNFDSLLLGSSRSTYFKEYHFDNKLFNYAANGMYPYEYEYFINTFEHLTGNTAKQIILGVDFFGSNKNKNKKPVQQIYLETTLSSIYKYKLLINYHIFKYSLQNIRQNMFIKKPFYDRKRVKSIKKINNLPLQIKKTVSYIQGYEYDSDLKGYWQNLQNNFANSQFIVFTTPVTMAQLKAYQEVGLMPFYFQWLKDLVEAFGSIKDFMALNSYTMDDNNFFDANHFTPAFADLLAKELVNKEDKIGITLDKTNIDAYIKELEQKINALE